MANFLVIGKHFADMRAKLASDNHVSLLLFDEALKPLPYLDTVSHIRCNFSSRRSILRALEQLDMPIDGVINMFEQYVLPASFIAGELGVLGLPQAAAEACNDKLLMRKLFAQSSQTISPEFKEVNSEEDITDFTEQFGFPVVIKPAHLSKSLLVEKCENLKQALTAYQHIGSRLTAVYAKYAPTRQPRLLIEQYMAGPSYSVAAFVDNEGEINMIDDAADLVTGNDAGYSDNFLYSRRMPTALSRQELDSLFQVAIAGIKSLGIKNSVTHIELIVTKDGPKLIEIAARIGGYRSEMLSLSHGVDMMEGIIATALGNQAPTQIIKNEPSATFELFPHQPGKFLSLANQDQLENLPSLNSFIIKKPLGSYTGKASDGFKACASIVLHNADRRRFETDFDFVKQHVKVITS